MGNILSCRAKLKNGDYLNCHDHELLLDDQVTDAMIERQAKSETLDASVMWTVEDLSAYFKTSVDTVQHIVNGSFPAPLILPGRGTGRRSLKRWFPEDVIAWAKKQKNALSK